MAKALKIEGRTKDFITALKKLDERNLMPPNADLIKILGINSISTISEIKGERQNIKLEAWEKFKSKFPAVISEIEAEKRDSEIGKEEEIPSNTDFKDKYYQQLEESNRALQKQIDIISKQADAAIMQAETARKNATTIASQQETIKLLASERGNANGRTASAM